MNFTFQNRPYKFNSDLGQNFVLDCSQNDDPKKKFSAVLWKDNKSDNQKFEVIPQQNGWYVVYNRMTNKVMQVEGSKINNGARVIFAESRKGNNELWQFIPVEKTNEDYKGKPAFYLRSFCGKTIDVKHAKAANDQEIFQYDYNGASNQIWVLE